MTTGPILELRIDLEDGRVAHVTPSSVKYLRNITRKEVPNDILWCIVKVVHHIHQNFQLINSSAHIISIFCKILCSMSRGNLAPVPRLCPIHAAGYNMNDGQSWSCMLLATLNFYTDGTTRTREFFLGGQRREI